MQATDCIAIVSYSSISALGVSKSEISEALRSPESGIVYRSYPSGEKPVAPISQHAEEELVRFESLHSRYRQLDRSTKLVLLAAGYLDLPEINSPVIVNVGTSRGSTGVWEKYHEDFLKSGRTSPKTSPLTTTGNISSYLAQYLKLDGITIDHSITCGSGSQAIANAYAWLRSGLVSAAVAGGTESPLTAFSVAQMESVGVYSKYQDAYPSKPCILTSEKQNSMVLGEGAAVFFLMKMSRVEAAEKGYPVIASVGFGNEKINSPTSVSDKGIALRNAMKRALEGRSDFTQKGCILAHSPGTINGDAAEYEAIREVFGSDLPPVLSGKWKIGHTLGASGALSVYQACLMLKGAEIHGFPYTSLYPGLNHTIDSVLVNATGFGGNAVSILIEKA